MIAPSPMPEHCRGLATGLLVLAVARVAHGVPTHLTDDGVLTLGHLDIGEVPVSTNNPYFNSAGKPYYTAMEDSMFTALSNTGCVWAWRRQQHAQSTLTDTCNAITAPFLKKSMGAVLGMFVTIVPDKAYLSAASSVPWAFSTNEHKVVWTSDTTTEIDMTGSDRPAPPHLWDTYPGLTKVELEDLSSKGAKLPEAYFTHALGETAFQLAGGNATATDAQLLLALKHVVELSFHVGNHAKQQDAPYDFMEDDWPSLLLAHLAHGAMYGYVKVGSSCVDHPTAYLLAPARLTRNPDLSQTL